MAPGIPSLIGQLPVKVHHKVSQASSGLWCRFRRLVLREEGDCKCSVLLYTLEWSIFGIIWHYDV